MNPQQQFQVQQRLVVALFLTILHLQSLLLTQEEKDQSLPLSRPVQRISRSSSKQS
jgi:hypothetical protein